MTELLSNPQNLEESILHNICDGKKASDRLDPAKRCVNSIFVNRRKNHEILLSGNHYNNRRD